MPNETFSALTKDQLSQLERTFGVRLPLFYRQFLLAYPCRLAEPKLRRESISDCEIIADYGRLIELNGSVRDPNLWFFGEHPWPNHFLAIGMDVYGCHYFIDTSGEHPGILFQDNDSWDIERKAESLDEFARQIEDSIAATYEA
ncbi:MAG: SMI1/KNR4 family protein [Chthoniobacteraceae bacterium]